MMYEASTKICLYYCKDKYGNILVHDSPVCADSVYNTGTSFYDVECVAFLPMNTHTGGRTFRRVL